MEQFYTVYFSKKSAVAPLRLQIIFNDSSEMSDYGKRVLAESDTDNMKPTLLFKSSLNYLNWLGGLIDCEKPFECLKHWFETANDYQKQILECQLYYAKNDCIEYVGYNDFSKEFLERFLNGKGIVLQRILLDENYKRLGTNNETDNIIYSYKSSNIRDITFATIHFALENGYKLAKCEHCGKYFFKSGGRNGSRQKFCTRKSPIPQYSHLSCEQAVRNINQQCTRIKNRIETKAQLYEIGLYSNFIYNFQNDCYVYKDKIKNSPTADNLNEYVDFLRNVEKERTWLSNGNNKQEK